MVFLREKGWKRIDQIENVDRDYTVFNLSVEEFPCYVVGNLGVLVHNRGPCDLDKILKSAPTHTPSKIAEVGKGPLTNIGSNPVLEAAFRYNLTRSLANVPQALVPKKEVAPQPAPTTVPEPATPDKPEAKTQTEEEAKKKACFAAGTKVMARGVWGTEYREIERLTSDDFVLSRDEFDQFGEIAWKPIESTAEFVAPILHVHVKGELIRCTTEHPFFVKNWGWVAAKDLEPGDLVNSWDGQWVAVDEVFHTGIEEKVYNITVGEFHTYFVGCDEWGFSVWVHNASVILRRYSDVRNPKLFVLRHWSIEVQAEKETQHSHQWNDGTTNPGVGASLDKWISDFTPNAQVQIVAAGAIPAKSTKDGKPTERQFLVEEAVAKLIIADVKASRAKGQYNLITNSCFTYISLILKTRLGYASLPTNPTNKDEMENLVWEMDDIVDGKK